MSKKDFIFSLLYVCLFTHIPTLSLQPPAPLIPTHLGPHTVSINIAKPFCTAET